ncbi:MAG TPA: YIP1 family protein [Chloroflexia bacterium]|nr:YIP1 family protein [Chloroflexia bacterium]
MAKLSEDLQQLARGERVYCLNCGALNETGRAECENCQFPLEKPAPLYVNLIQTVIKPMRAMARIAATVPVIQAVFVVLLVAAISMLIYVSSVLFQLQYYFEDFSRITPTLRDFFLKNPAPDFGFNYFLTTLFFTFIPWLAFTIAVFYVARLFFRNDARTNFAALLSITGFARIVQIATVVFLLFPFNPDDTIRAIESGLSIAILAWQIALITIGVRISTGLSWNRASLVTVIPALLFQFLLGLPI